MKYKRNIKVGSYRHGHFLVPALAVMAIATIGAYFLQSSMAATAGTAHYTIATYNLLGAGYPQAPPFNRSHGTTTASRSEAAATVMKNQGVDVFGVQELDGSDEQFAKFRNQVDGRYNSHPASVNASNRIHQRAIFWQQNRFYAINKGSIGYPFQDAPYLNPNDRAPWVLLRDRYTGVTFYVINIHLVARNDGNCRYNCNPPPEPGSSDPAGAEKRKRAAHLIKSWVQNHKQQQPIILLGDMNSAFTLSERESKYINSRSELPYCIFTSQFNGKPLLRRTADVRSGRTGTCPYRGTERLIDHIYVTQAFRVNSAIRFNSDATQRASDHRPVIAKLSINYDGSGHYRELSDQEASNTSEMSEEAQTLPDDSAMEANE